MMRGETKWFCHNWNRLLRICNNGSGSMVAVADGHMSGNGCLRFARPATIPPQLDLNAVYYRIGLSSWHPFACAGLWHRWKNPETGEETRSCTILTCPPNELIEPIHDRMPVILPPEQYGAWLDRTVTDGQEGHRFKPRRHNSSREEDGLYRKMVTLMAELAA